MASTRPGRNVLDMSFEPTPHPLPISKQTLPGLRGRTCLNQEVSLICTSVRTGLFTQIRSGQLTFMIS